MKLSEYADLFIRLPVGFHLIYGVIDNVVSWDRMLEFASFLEQHGLAMSLIGAHISVYAQLISGICFITGLKLRWAASIMIVNFIVAIILVHLNDPYPNKFPAIMMLAASMFFLVNGVGNISLDHYFNKK